MLTDAHITQWHKSGYVLVHDMVDVTAARQAMQEEATHRHANERVHDFGNDRRLEFPCGVDALDRVPVHPTLLLAASTLLKSKYVLLHQAVAWTKYGEPPNKTSAESNDDQRLHQDFANNMWVVPTDWHRPDAVAAIVFYSDVQKTGGGTAVVPRRHWLPTDELYTADGRMQLCMPGIAGVPFVNDRETAEKMLRDTHFDAHAARSRGYAREVMVDDARPGSVLLYRLDVWHRGTPVYKGHARCVHNMVWKRPDAVTMPQCGNWNAGYGRLLYYGWLERFVASLRADQLLALGFPPPESPYWTAHTLHLVRRRFEGIDLSYAVSRL